MTDIDLNFIAKQIERVINEIASAREDVNVLTAIVLRQDATLTAVLHELRATHNQMARFNDRLRKVENAS